VTILNEGQTCKAKLADSSTLLSSLLTGLAALHIPSCYLIVPAIGLSNKAIKSFWEALERADTLKYRWSDTPGITSQEAFSLSIEQTHMYHVIDSATGAIVAEFALDTFTGKAAQVHFSMHPDNDSALNWYLFDAVSDQILYYWKALENLDQPYLDTVFGLTPVANRAACLFVLKSKFKKIGVLPRGSHYLGSIVDSLVTAKTRN